MCVTTPVVCKLHTYLSVVWLLKFVLHVNPVLLGKGLLQYTLLGVIKNNSSIRMLYIVVPLRFNTRYVIVCLQYKHFDVEILCIHNNKLGNIT